MRLADRIGPDVLAAVYEEHTSGGALEFGAHLSEADAVEQLPIGVLQG